MLSNEQLQSMFCQELNELPEELRKDVVIEFNQGNPLHGKIDVVIMQGDQCMALGRFQPVREHVSRKEAEAGFSFRFNMAMGYHTEPWYLFGYDGERIVLNDLSMDRQQDEFPETIYSGIRRLTTLPKQWHAEAHTLVDMNRYLETLSKLIDEDVNSNNVK